jgi:hypothetical protein
MSEIKKSASEAERRFAELRDWVEQRDADENRLAELDAILGPREYDDVRFHASYDEVESRASLAADDPARERAAKILEELVASRELRQALLPRHLGEGSGAISDWFFIWQDLEDERRRLVLAESPAADHTGAGVN